MRDHHGFSERFGGPGQRPGSAKRPPTRRADHPRLSLHDAPRDRELWQASLSIRTTDISGYDKIAR
jgi:hypothetical protein